MLLLIIFIIFVAFRVKFPKLLGERSGERKYNENGKTLKFTNDEDRAASEQCARFKCENGKCFLVFLGIWGIVFVN